jgi:hypothetical protein
MIIEYVKTLLPWLAIIFFAVQQKFSKSGASFAGGWHGVCCFMFTPEWPARQAR